MNLGIIIGTVAFLIGLFALIAALTLRFSQRRNQGQLLRYFFYAGIPILFLTSFAGLWDCYKAGDWSKSLVPVGLLFMALNALLVGTRSIKAVSGGADEIQAKSLTSREASGRENP